MESGLATQSTHLYVGSILTWNALFVDRTQWEINDTSKQPRKVVHAAKSNRVPYGTGGRHLDARATVVALRAALAYLNAKDESMSFMSTMHCR